MFVLVFRPFNSIAFNILQILNELFISVGYSMCGVFLLYDDIDNYYKAWSVLSPVYMCYIIHLSLILWKFCKLAIRKLKNCMQGNENIINKDRREI
jgi:hypothetical protein